MVWPRPAGNGHQGAESGRLGLVGAGAAGTAMSSTHRVDLSFIWSVQAEQTFAAFWKNKAARPSHEDWPVQGRPFSTKEDRPLLKGEQR
jgi:hypothetical protein